VDADFKVKRDFIEIVDKNERSFKQYAEKMIEETSQLIDTGEELKKATDAQGFSVLSKERLMHQRQFNMIAGSY